MNKLEKRAIMCLIFALILVVGVGIFIYRLVVDGDTWASYPANKHIYQDGKLTQGTIYDRNGILLLENTKSGTPNYAESASMRRANLHVTGDKDQNIGTGANAAFAGKLVGYNFINGVFSTAGKGRNLHLTVDGESNKIAHQALNGRNGTVGVFNYKTGEIISMVSSPTYDPQNPDKDGVEEGAYINKLISAAIVPGSIFKAITTTAALEEMSDISSWEYTCTGSIKYGKTLAERVTCPRAHGKVDISEAFAVSCNCAYATLSERLGPSTLEKYTEKAGLTRSYSIDGIKTAKGAFDFPEKGINLAWSGIGQHHDLVNPAAMMVYMGAIANGGETVVPKIIDKETFEGGFSASLSWTKDTGTLISKETAAKIGPMLSNNVKTYGTWRFPGLSVYGKTGTAEVGGKKTPNAWFTGYIEDESHPYAFIVLVENGGEGSVVATGVANKVLQYLVNK